MKNSTYIVKEEKTRDGKFSSGKIKLYEEVEHIKYPRLVVDICDLNSKGYKAKVLGGMVRKGDILNKGEELYLYVEFGEEVVEVGVLERKQLRSFLINVVFKKYDKYVELNGGTKIKGDMLFALCSG